ncbi:MAG TPA: hypothetical protein VFL90_15390 [Methylomirabilota bacterium]|nr:hypothetical protein [Methylomirabilota bacterium]
MPPSAPDRLIIVARDEPDLYDFIRRDNVGDDRVQVIADRRVGDRRASAAAHAPERRRRDRRRNEVEPQLRTAGWIEIRLAPAL